MPYPGVQRVRYGEVLKGAMAYMGFGASKLVILRPPVPRSTAIYVKAWQ
jgi:hypothetical protein